MEKNSKIPYECWEDIMEASLAFSYAEEIKKYCNKHKQCRGCFFDKVYGDCMFYATNSPNEWTILEPNNIINLHKKQSLT